LNVHDVLVALSPRRPAKVRRMSRRRQRAGRLSDRRPLSAGDAALVERLLRPGAPRRLTPVQEWYARGALSRRMRGAPAPG
jgi:hypothetical protein